MPHDSALTPAEQASHPTGAGHAISRRCYLDSDSLSMQTQVLACDADGQGGFQLVLADTLFHPQGGGQPADQGWVGEAQLLRIGLVGDTLVHVCDRPVALGEVQIRVQPEPRALHARLHSAGHLLSYAGETLGWRGVKGHHWPGEARVIFEAEAGAAAMSAEQIEALANAYVAADLPRQMQYQGGQRMLGFGGLPLSGCGGTHVASTGAIGPIKVLKTKDKKGQLWVYYELLD